ncbi:hypothetical protein DXG01_003413 [Tephrocybe rancida]|nr:hypothetical protein DXG01_003413 [Tephrocybe rancida]
MNPSTSSADPIHNQHVDLVGGPFAVIESDPGVFTSLTRKLGARNIELVEMYDIEPWAVDHLNPHGLIFCFLWRKDAHRPADFDDPAAERVWFANQLSDDACASHAILNVLLNCPDIDLGGELRDFRQDTERMSPVMKGLAITNSPLLRKAHNSLARPADIRGSLNVIASTTLDEAKAKAKVKATPTRKRGTKPPPAKRAKTAAEKPSPSKAKPKPTTEDEDEEEVYHFIGYVPAYGKVWELDGLKSGPLEVGELPFSPPSSSGASGSRREWMDIVRPALRMKMEKYGGAAEGGDNIRFSLLAIVDGVYEQASDVLQLLKRERAALERQMGDGWETKVDPDLLATAQHAFSAAPGFQTYAIDFGAQFMEISVRIQNMPEAELVSAWETCVRNAMRANVNVEDELSKAVRANVRRPSVLACSPIDWNMDGQTDDVKRTFDYEPFLKAFLERLQVEGLLGPLMGREADGSKSKTPAKAKQPQEEAEHD